VYSEYYTLSLVRFIELGESQYAIQTRESS